MNGVQLFFHGTESPVMSPNPVDPGQLVTPVEGQGPGMINGILFWT